MIPGSDEYRLDELDELIAKERGTLNVLLLRERAVRERIKKYEQERKNLCPHASLKMESSYHEGSYDDHAYTDYWNVCIRCGGKSTVKTKMHSYYG